MIGEMKEDWFLDELDFDKVVKHNIDAHEPLYGSDLGARILDERMLAGIESNGNLWDVEHPLDLS